MTFIVQEALGKKDLAIVPIAWLDGILGKGKRPGKRLSVEHNLRKRMPETTAAQRKKSKGAAAKMKKSSKIAKVAKSSKASKTTGRTKSKYANALLEETGKYAALGSKKANPAKTQPTIFVGKNDFENSQLSARTDILTGK